MAVLALAMAAVLPPQMLPAAPGPTASETNRLPVYELRISGAELTKLKRNPRSEERHPAIFIAAGKEYSVGVRYRGDWARTWPKKPLKIFFEKDKEFEGNHVLNLNSCWRDPAFIREQLAYHIYTACSVPSPKSRMVRVNMNSQFYGLFVEVEQPDKRFLKRVNLKGAAIYKANSRSNRSDERDLGTEAAFQSHYEKETRKDEGFRDLQGFCHELAATPNAARFFETQVDLDRYVNYLVATTFVQNWDYLDKNHFLLHDVDGSKKWFIVPWDLDRTLGDHWDGSFDETQLPLELGTSALPRNRSWNRLFDAFVKEPALRARFLDRLEALLEKEFTKEKLFPILDQLESQIRADAALDRQRWPNEDGGNVHQGIAGVKRYIEQRRAYLVREIKAQRARKTVR
jgi:spore coat protein H